MCDGGGTYHGDKWGIINMYGDKCGIIYLYGNAMKFATITCDVWGTYQKMATQFIFIYCGTDMRE